MPYDKPLIGILLSKDDGDIVNDIMAEYNKYFDAIYCIDASSDNSLDIIRSFDKVKYAKSEKELGITGYEMKDGIRQLLLPLVQKDYGCDDGWIFPIHTDEMYVGNPRNILSIADSQGARVINCIVAHFIMHKEDKETENKKHITDRKLWYWLGQCESSGFKNQPGISYQIGEHMKVIPNGVEPYTVCDSVLLRRHYNQRTEDQLRKRIKDRLETGWQPAYKALEDNFYITSPYQMSGSGEVYSLITKFDGDFKFSAEHSYWNRRIIT
jgi:hypothetical protein